MQVSKEDAFEIISDDHPDWKRVFKKLIDERRWVNVYRVVTEHISTGKFYETFYDASEDQSPFEYDEPVFTEVEKKEVVVVKYAPVK